MRNSMVRFLHSINVVLLGVTLTMDRSLDMFHK
jgi:hypothetical protein